MYAPYSELPDLYYDHHELPSPPSATSSNMVSTPPLDWQPWLSVDDAKSPSEPQPYQQQQSWQSSPLVATRPMVHLIDTECNWIYQQQHSGALEPSSILFSSYQQPHHTSSSLSLSSSLIHSSQAPQTQSAHAYYTGFISPSGAALSSSSPLSAPTTVSPSALTLYPSAVSPPYPSASASTSGQVSLKLHQPRPSRKIPIVSLSELATACDDFQINPQPKEPNERSSVAQVNLPFGPNASKSYHPMAYHSSNQFIRHTHPKSDIYGTPFPSGTTNNTGTFPQCACSDCMSLTPYICQ